MAENGNGRVTAAIKWVAGVGATLITTGILWMTFALIAMQNEMGVIRQQLHALDARTSTRGGVPISVEAAERIQSLEQRVSALERRVDR